MQAQLWTVSGLAVELGRDRRSLSRALEGLTPDEEGHDKAGRVSRSYRMARVVKHLYARGSGDYDDQSQRLAAAKAERVEHDNGVRRGHLAERAAVIRFWTECIANMRAKALAMASKLSPQLVNIGDASIIAAAIRAEVVAFLAELSEYDAGGRAGVVGGGEEGGSATADADGEPVVRPRAKAVNGKQRRARAVEN